MTIAHALHCYLIFAGSGPILVLSTYPGLDDERLRSRLRYKGIDNFIAYEIDETVVAARYPDTFAVVAVDLDREEDIRVLDFNGHQIMARFNLDDLGAPIRT